jgi:hypothetical protein
MTFAEIRKAAQGNDPLMFLRAPQLERSLRRALLTMVRQGAVVTIEGRGDPGSPYRYSLHPMLVGMMMAAKPADE